MMNENTLKQYVDNFFDELELYDDLYNNHNYKVILKAHIDVFFENETSFNAYGIYETILSIYQILNEDKSNINNSRSVSNERNIPMDFLKIMVKYNKMIKDNLSFNPVCSVNIFLLGLGIYSQNKTLRRIFKNHVIKSPYEKYYRLNGEISNEEFFYRWSISSLFHDICIPVELLSKPIKKLLNKELNTFFRSNGENITLNFLHLKKLNSLNKSNYDFADSYNKNYPETKFLDLFKPTEILIHKLSLDFNLDLRQQDLLKDQIYQNLLGDCPCEDDGIKDHGIISSIAVLDLYGYLIQKFDKNPDFFFYPIADSSIAIFLHNVYEDILMKKPYGFGKLEPNTNPLSFLLILCDNLMFWKKQEFNNQFEKKFNNNVIGMDLNIFDDKIDIIYKINEVSEYNLKEKEAYINKLLDLNGIFHEGLTIKFNIFEDNINKKDDKAYIPIISIDIIYQLTQIIYNQHYYNVINLDNETKKINEIDENLHEYESICEFDKLDPMIKFLFITLAKLIQNELKFRGYEFAQKTDERREITNFSEKEIENISFSVHEDFIKNQINIGLEYGEKKDNYNLITPHLVSWNELDLNVKNYYYDLIKNISHMVNSMGLKIVKIRK